jgi:hypothetical protein
MIKEQCIHRQHFDSIQHATRAIGDWVSFDNNRRPHQALELKMPAEAYVLAAQTEKIPRGRYSRKPVAGFPVPHVITLGAKDQTSVFFAANIRSIPHGRPRGGRNAARSIDGRFIEAALQHCPLAERRQRARKSVSPPGMLARSATLSSTR